VLMTAGVVILLFGVYELYGTGLTTAREQDRLERQLGVQWADPSAAERAAPPARPSQPQPSAHPSPSSPSRGWARTTGMQSWKESGRKS
jgi:hypothetical protein